MAITLRTGAAWGVAALLILTACSNGSSPSPSAMTTSASATSSASPASTAAPTTASTPGITVSAWREVAPDPLAGITNIVRVASSASRFVITVASMSGDVQFLTSSDGQTWTTSPAGSMTYPAAYAFDGASGVAVGGFDSPSKERAAVWTSPDGQTWTRLPNQQAFKLRANEAGLNLTGVAHGPAGYVALGLARPPDNGLKQHEEALVFWSADGHHWQRVPSREFQDLGALYQFDDVVVVHGRYLITGEAVGGTGVWTSTDGQHWTMEPLLAGNQMGFDAMVGGPAGALLIGDRAWWSADGLAWTQLPKDACPPASDVITTGFGFAAPISPAPPATPTPAPSAVATATPVPLCPDLSEQPVSTVRVSTTGERWTSLPLPSAVLPNYPGGTLAATQTRLLWIGSTAVDRNTLDVWIADLQEGP